MHTQCMVVCVPGKHILTFASDSLHMLVGHTHACARARTGLVCRGTSAAVPKLCVSMPSRSAIINIQHKASSRRWGLGKQRLNHFAFSLAELLLTRGRRCWEPFMQSLARVSNCNGGRPRAIPTSPPLRHPGVQEG